MAYATLANVYSNARFRTGTSSSDFSDSDTNLLGLANKHFRHIVLELADANSDYYTKISSFNLSDGGSPYSISSDSSLSGGGNIKVLRVEVTYDGTNWEVATPLQYGEIATPTILEADVDNNFSIAEPYYALWGNKIYMLPDADTTVTNGLRVFEVVRRKELTASTDRFMDQDGTGEFQLPKEFMEVMEEYLTADLYERLGRVQESIATRAYAEKRLKEIKGVFSRQDENFDLTVKTLSDYGE